MAMLTWPERFVDLLNRKKKKNVRKGGKREIKLRCRLAERFF